MPLIGDACRGAAWGYGAARFCALGSGVEFCECQARESFRTAEIYYVVGGRYLLLLCKKFLPKTPISGLGQDFRVCVVFNFSHGSRKQKNGLLDVLDDPH